MTVGVLLNRLVMLDRVLGLPVISLVMLLGLMVLRVRELRTVVLWAAVLIILAPYVMVCWVLEVVILLFCRPWMMVIVTFMRVIGAEKVEEAGVGRCSTERCDSEQRSHYFYLLRITLLRNTYKM